MNDNKKEINQPADEAEKAENAQEVLKDEQLEDVAGGFLWLKRELSDPHSSGTTKF